MFAAQVTYATGYRPSSAAAADVNGDNIPDIIVANEGSTTVSVLLNAGNGTFTNQTIYAVGMGPSSVAAADVNGDNKPDIIVANWGSNTTSVLLALEMTGNLT